MAATNGKATIGWREWMSLPTLGIPAIKAKIDTGARTSCLHAFIITPYEEEGILRVRFGIHPLKKRKALEFFCDAEVKDHRSVTDSGGHSEMRFVIESFLELGGFQWNAEITLTNRDTMRFRMLLGRTALKDRFVVDPARSYLTGREFAKRYPRPTVKRKKKP